MTKAELEQRIARLEASLHAHELALESHRTRLGEYRLALEEVAPTHPILHFHATGPVYSRLLSGILDALTYYLADPKAKGALDSLTDAYQAWADRFPRFTSKLESFQGRGRARWGERAA
jgi:hypothetical protein